MLTQTRPNDQTPVVYRAVPATQESVASTSRSQRLLSQRQPLGTLSFTSTMSSPSEKQPLTRAYLDDFEQRVAEVPYWAPELRMFGEPSQHDLDALGGLVSF